MEILENGRSRLRRADKGHLDKFANNVCLDDQPTKSSNARKQAKSATAGEGQFALVDEPRPPTSIFRQQYKKITETTEKSSIRRVLENILGNKVLFAYT